MTCAPVPQPRPHEIVPVNAGDASYSVRIGADLLADLGPLLAEIIPPRRAFLVYDANLPEQVVAEAARSLAHLHFETHATRLLPDEREKSLRTVEALLRELAQAGIERTDPVIALGGGVVGDVAGFVAATYRRGCPFVQCPTTLLAMVDASVGGKTGVNLLTEGGLRKNFVGAFHQPRLVVADPRVLDSLPMRHLRAGLAECVKHALLARTVLGSDAGAAFLRDTERLIPGAIERDAASLAQLVALHVRLKAAVVAADERESPDATGVSRMLLNLGHTFAHAIEPSPDAAPSDRPDDRPLLHGEAVALGILAACACGESLGATSSETTTLARRMLSAAGLPTAAVGLPPTDSLVSAMREDKKSLSGSLRTIMPTTPGEAQVVRDPDPAALRAGFDAVRA